MAKNIVTLKKLLVIYSLCFWAWVSFKTIIFPLWDIDYAILLVLFLEVLKLLQKVWKMNEEKKNLSPGICLLKLNFLVERFSV